MGHGVDGTAQGRCNSSLYWADIWFHGSWNGRHLSSLCGLSKDICEDKSSLIRGCKLRSAHGASSLGRHIISPHCVRYLPSGLVWHSLHVHISQRIWFVTLGLPYMSFGGVHGRPLLDGVLRTWSSKYPIFSSQSHTCLYTETHAACANNSYFFLFPSGSHGNFPSRWPDSTRLSRRKQVMTGKSARTIAMWGFLQELRRTPDDMRRIHKSALTGAYRVVSPI